MLVEKALEKEMKTHLGVIDALSALCLHRLLFPLLKRKAGKTYACLFYLSAIPICSYARRDTSPINQGKILLYTYSQCFIENTEYFNKIMEGETIFGFHLLPSLHCLINDTIGLKLGCFWDKPFGDKHPWAGIRPALSLYYKNKKNALIMGIFGLMDAPPTLVAPLFDSYYRRPFMEGLYFTLTHPMGHASAWLDWQQRLSTNKEQPEIFTIYVDADYHYKSLEQTTPFRLPLQLAIYHLGGQGIAVKTYSLFCAALGIALTYMPSHRFLQQLSWSSYLLGNRYVKEVDRPFKGGWGHLHHLVIGTPYLTFGISYWHGNKFSSENMGYQLYQSIRTEKKDEQSQPKVIHQEPIRRLLLFSFYKNWEPYSGIVVEAAYRPYYDIKNRLWEYGFSFKLSYDVPILLKELETTAPTL